MLGFNIVWRDFWFNKVCATTWLPYRFRPFFMRLGGVKVGKRVVWHARNFVGNKNLEIGDHAFINYDVWFNTAGKIVIGSNVNIAYKVVFVTSTHEIGTSDKRAGKISTSGIVVEDGSWIGAGAMILPGVHIGKGCIIAAGSVVTHDCEPNGIYAGNPAKLIRKLSEDQDNNA